MPPSRPRTSPFRCRVSRLTCCSTKATSSASAISSCRSGTRPAIPRDSCVGVIDAHHGSNIPEFLQSLQRIRRDDAEFLLPSHGPLFRRDNRILQKAIDRLTQYQYMADFGTCAIAWPLLDEWEADVLAGKMPDFSKGAK